MKVLNMFHGALDWATGKKTEVPQSRLATMGTDFIGWITASQPATTSQPGGLRSLFSKSQPQTEAPEGIKRMFIVALRAGITVAGATAIVAATAGAFSVSGIAMGYFGAAIERLSTGSTSFVATACGSTGYGLQWLGDCSGVAGNALFAGVQDFVYMVSITLPVYLYENMLSLVQETLSWLNTNVLQPGLGLAGDCFQRSWNLLPTKQAALEGAMSFFKRCGDGLYSLADRIGLISTAT